MCLRRTSWPFRASEIAPGSSRVESNKFDLMQLTSSKVESNESNSETTRPNKESELEESN